MSRYAFIQSKDAGHVKWQAWPVHRRLVEAIDASDRLVILKARQIGVSWLVAGYALWRAILHPSENVLLMSQGEDEAAKLLGKCRYIYDFLPIWMQPELGRANAGALEFPGLRSAIYALPSTHKAGRSEGSTLIVCDEWAWHPYAAENWAAIQPTLGSRAKFLGISTANGRGGHFHEVWQGAETGSNGFRAVFASCWEAPGRDEAWYAQQEREYSATPHLLAQEHPRNAAEAFISSGNCRFDTVAIQEALERCEAPDISLDLTAGGNGQMLLWQRPITGRRYVIGADVAEGNDVGNGRLDYCHATVLDWETGRHVASLHGQWEPSSYALYLDQIGRSYGQALLGVERNNHGHAVLLELSRHLDYPRLYWHIDPLKSQEGDLQKADLGWPTTTVTKPVLVNLLSEAISQRQMLSPDRAFWDECLSFVNLGNGRVGGQAGTHDDRVMATAIALQMRTVPPRREPEVTPLAISGFRTQPTADPLEQLLHQKDAERAARINKLLAEQQARR